MGVCTNEGACVCVYVCVCICVIMCVYVYVYVCVCIHIVAHAWLMHVTHVCFFSFCFLVGVVRVFASFFMERRVFSTYSLIFLSVFSDMQA